MKFINLKISQCQPCSCIVLEKYTIFNWKKKKLILLSFMENHQQFWGFLEIIESIFVL